MNSRFTPHTADHSLATDSRAMQPEDIYNPQPAPQAIGTLSQTDQLTDQLQALQEELQNPLSFWQELRITPMSGTDYVFIPSFVYQAFGPSYSMTRFIAELSCAFGLELNRLQVVCIAEQENESRTFSKAIIEWAGGGVSHSHQEIVPSESSYYTFIESMYQYSTSLASQLEH